MDETWRPVLGLEDIYEISNLGRVRNVGTRHPGYTGRILKIKIDRYGYPMVTLRRLGVTYYRTIHRLVATAFLGPCPEGLQVNHKDGNKLNNTPENLEYVTTGQNTRHSARMGLQTTGNNHWTRRFPERLKRGKASPFSKFNPNRGRRKLNSQQVIEIRDRYARDDISLVALAAIYNVNPNMVRNIIHRRAWKRV